ncbi:MAG: hypothetical protein KJZ59_09870 [Pararhodobacter sp.]|nr:hypothetical protein [Pararhodobacter sp.]
MFRFRRKKPASDAARNRADNPTPAPARSPGKSSHWIDGPSEMASAAMQYFGAADRSQDLILQAMREIRPIASVVDFGTGRGSWLKAAIGMGASDVRGYDIPEIPVAQRQFPADRFVAADLGQPVRIERQFDLSISTEVAEHLPKEHAATFVANVAGASDLVLFSAAIPYQGGAGHVNENWVEYWVKLFAAQGFACYDILRLRFWNEAAIRSYYRQNLLVFARGQAADALRTAGHRATPQAPSLVHPEQYLKSIGRALPPELATVGADVRHYYDCVTKSPAQVDADPNRRVYGKVGVGFGAIRTFLDRP